MYISTPPSPKVENFQMKIFLSRWGSDPVPAELEADMLPSEPARQAIKLNMYVMELKIININGGGDRKAFTSDSWLVLLGLQMNVIKHI